MAKAPDHPMLESCDALTSLDRINSIIVEYPDLDQMLCVVLDEVLDLFQCDRAWLIYPSDPETDHVNVRCERNRPEWPGVAADTGSFPNTGVIKEFLELCSSDSGPFRFDSGTTPIKPLDDPIVEKFNIRSQMFLPLKPSLGPDWVFGIHHCAQAVRYDETVDLFHAIGKRIGNGITTALALRDLRESEKRYRSLVDHAPEAILVVDIDTGRFTEANSMAAKLFGTSVENLTRTFCIDDISPEFQPDGTRSADLAFARNLAAYNGEPQTFEWTVQNASNELIPCEVSLTHYPDSTRKSVRGSVLDISKRKSAEKSHRELEARLAKAQKLESVGLLTGGVAHDFNNLLNVVLGNLELLQMETQGDSVAQELIQNGITATLKGAELTKNMLSFARRAQLTPERLNLNQIVDGIRSWSGRTIPVTIELNVTLTPDLWPIVADFASTESSILNLIINARDAMENNGTLQIETRNVTISPDDLNDIDFEITPGDYVVLCVSDTGSGIADDIIDHVFEPFYTTKATGQGSGLGLSMVHGFMKQSGGTVQINSQLGKGSSVKLFFPAQSSPDNRLAAPIVGEASAKNAPLRILVAEDQPQVLKTIMRILQRAGHDVAGVSSGDEALTRYQTGELFDLLITDMVMPGTLQGRCLAQALREITPTLPVIFMTGYASDAPPNGAKLRTSDIQLMKPISRAQLIATITDVMAASRS